MSFKKILVAIFFVFSIFLSANTVFSVEMPAAKSFALLNYDNQLVNLSDFKDKMLLVNFFATYCPPCRAEMPDFIRLQEKYGDKGFNVIAISVDNEYDRLIPHFVKAAKINFPVLRATRQVVKDYGNVFALPVSFLLNKEHKIIEKINGPVSIEDIEPVIKKELGIK
jgi:cytochrome c biogenesis protein CcmG/thiol:disulfide interchange protein DsbE